MCISNNCPNGALYRKMMQSRFKLSTMHPSETNNNFKNSCLKTISFLVKNKSFYNITIKIKIFCNKNNIGLKYFADNRFRMFLVKIDKQK